MDKAKGEKEGEAGDDMEKERKKMRPGEKERRARGEESKEKEEREENKKKVTKEGNGAVNWVKVNKGIEKL